MNYDVTLFFVKGNPQPSLIFYNYAQCMRAFDWTNPNTTENFEILVNEYVYEMAILEDPSYSDYLSFLWYNFDGIIVDVTKGLSFPHSTQKAIISRVVSHVLFLMSLFF